MRSRQGYIFKVVAGGPGAEGAGAGLQGAGSAGGEGTGAEAEEDQPDSITLSLIYFLLI